MCPTPARYYCSHPAVFPSALPRCVSLPESILDWLRLVHAGQCGHIPLCAAVHSSLGLASHLVLVLLVLVAGFLRPPLHRAEPSEPTKGDDVPREYQYMIVTAYILFWGQWHLSLSETSFRLFGHRRFRGISLPGLWQRQWLYLTAS